MNPVGRRVRTPPRRDEGIAPYHHNKRVGMKFKARDFALAAALIAAGLLSTCEAAYPGNPNFRNLAVTYAAQTRTSWETNAVTASLSKTVDWTKGETISPGVTYVPAVLTTDGGWPRTMVCHCVRVDLTTPGSRVTGTDRRPEGWGDPMPEPEALKDDGTYYKKRTVREKTGDFIARNRGSKDLGGKARDTGIAFNAAAWGPWVSPNTNLWGDINGPFYADGIKVSASGSGYGTHSTSNNQNGIFVVYKTGKADIIGNLTSSNAKKVWFSVPAFHYRLVRDGQPVASSDTSVRPRTAIGISQDKNTFYALVCDGDNEKNWTKGCDFTSLGKILAGMGCHDAINLDGGGSSNMCAWDSTNNRPKILGRPSGNYSQRDNGANAAIYYKMPAAMISTYLYDDMDFLLQDIADGRSPSNKTTINVLGEATFTAEHPYVPKGSFTISSTNGASIGWADGVTPQVAAGATNLFKNIRFRDAERELVVAPGGVVKLNGVTGLGGVSIDNSSALVVAGSIPDGLRVRCAAASAAGTVFAKSSLSLDAARAQASKFVCATDDSLVGTAVEEGGSVKFKWEHIVTFGRASAKIAETLDRGVVKVNVAECASAYASGYRLKLTVTSEDGLRSSTQFVDFAGAGEYVFDTASEAATDSSICASGYGYSYTVELVNDAGVRVEHTDDVSGTMGLGVERPWFAARAAGNSAVGGSWTEKPAITNGTYEVTQTSNAVFKAFDEKDGRVRFEMDAVFKGYLTEFQARNALEQFAEYGTPHGACFLAKANFDGDLAWRGLVKENGSPTFKLLYGPAALNTPCKVITDVDWSSGVPRVRYSVVVSGVETALVDAEGQCWFAGAGQTNHATGRMAVAGMGSVSSFCGKSVVRKLLKFFGIVLR